jgi:hypothetical protein
VTAHLDDATLWITSARGTFEKRRCRVLTVLDAEGRPCFQARAFPWDRQIVVRTADAEQRAIVVIQRRRFFVVTGRVDIMEAGGRRLGVVTRGGDVRNTRGTLVGRFRDARTLTRKTAEAATVTLGNIMMGLDSSGDGVAGTDVFVFSIEGRYLGSLMQMPLPFVTSETTPAPRRGLERLLSARWLTTLSRRFRPRGWRFTRVYINPGEDARLVLAGALFTVELSHW